MSWVRMGDTDPTDQPMRRSVVWKHRVPIVGRTEIRPGRVVHAEYVPGSAFVTVWVHHDCPGAVDLVLAVAATGQPFDAMVWEHVVTAAAPDLSLVWHVVRMTVLDGRDGR